MTPTKRRTALVGQWQRSRLAPLLAVAATFALIAGACSSGGVEIADAPSATDGPDESVAPADDESPTPQPGAEEPTPDELRNRIPDFPEPTVDDTPLPVDPDVRIGTLDNGLTYYVRSNDSPGSAIELRLAVRAGSLQQVAGDDGLAHILEHMLFNGTEAYPGTSVEDALNELGAAIGPHINAYTTFGETVYQLSFPTNDDDVVDTGLGVLREFAGNATLDPDEVVNERGVVLEEWRASDADPFVVVNEVFDEAYFSSSYYGEAFPIGSPDNITSAEAPPLRQFYDDWYRPDMMAVIAVGDVPAGELEQQIIDVFSDLTDRGTTPERTNVEVAAITEPFTAVVAEPGQAAQFISLDFVIPTWDPSTVGGERLGLIEELMAAMIQSRLDEASRSGRSELIAPSVGAYDYTRDHRILGFNTDAPDLVAGLEYILTDLSSLRVTGFSEAELARAIDTYRAGLDSFLAGAGSTQDADFAYWYGEHFVGDFDISSIDDRHVRLNALLDGFDTTDINDHYRWWMHTAAPISILVSPDPDALPTNEELEERVAAAIAAGLESVGSDAAEVAEITELMAPPDAVDPIDSGEIADLDAVYWEFDNGVTVVFAQSDISQNAVIIDSLGFGGWSTLPPGANLTASIATEAVASSGLGSIERVAFDRFLRDSTAYVGAYIEETDDGMFGGADVVDIEEMFQLFHLTVTDATIDDAGLRQALATAKDIVRANKTDPYTILINGLLEGRYGDNPYQQVQLTQDVVDSLSADGLLELYNSRLGKVDDQVIVIVGDVDVDIVENLARRYLGTLPAGADDTFEEVTGPAPDDTITIEVSGGIDDGAAGVAYLYEATFDVDLDDRVAADVLTTIIDERLFESLREELGATYSGGQVGIFTSYGPGEGASAFILAEGDPERIDLIRATVTDTLADIVANGVAADEFGRAVAVVQGGYDFTSNSEISDEIFDRLRFPDEQTFTFDTRYDSIRGLTEADVEVLAVAVFGVDGWVEAVRTSG